MVVLEFSDSGPGMEQPDRVFDPFYTTRPIGQGTGLGLSVCYGIIQEHNGTITCLNHAEGGATFRIELPAVVDTINISASVARIHDSADLRSEAKVVAIH
jgi:signal transduction histidine kinase